MLFRFACLAVVVPLVLSSVVLAAGHAKETLAQVKMAVDNQQAVLIDVREKRELGNGYIEDAISLPLSELNGNVDVERLKAKLPSDKVLYTYCVVGKRALTVANILEKHGYEVRGLKPGYKELVEAGFPKAKD